MALHTSNLYGKIIVTNESIRTVAGAAALESYGISGLGHKFGDKFYKVIFRKKSFGRAVHIVTVNNRIYFDINVIIKFGVSVDAVMNSVRSAVKYNVENFSGMIVDCININILGIRN